VPLGDTYMELIAVVDGAEAAQSPVGRWVAEARDGRPLGWCLRTDRLDDVAGRLDMTIVAVSRARPDGRVFRGRIAGIEQATAEPSLPFFIEREESSPFPGAGPVTHRAGSVKIARVELSGDADRLDGWLGSHDLPITIRPGEPAVASIVLRGDVGEIVVDEL
jgi:Glyoxalase-like domain